MAMATPLAIAAPLASPTVELSMEIVPEELYLFPTYHQIGRLEFQGTIYCDKSRPDEVRVYIEAWIDVPWAFHIEPEVMVFRKVGEQHHQFQIYLSVPPRTAGPPIITMGFRAYADVVARDVECTGQSVMHIVQDVGGFIESYPEKIMVSPDRGIDGEIFIENLLDEELEVHISPSEEWESVILDMDFQLDIVLQPYEQRSARFHGILSDEVEPGDYPVQLELWTPGIGTDRNIITMANITLRVMEDPGDSISGAITRALVPIILLVTMALGLVTYWFINRRDRLDTQDQNC
jgi:hypothetical protein